MKWVFASFFLVATAFAAEYKIIRLDAKEVKAPENAAYLIFDIPKVKEFKVDGASVVRNGQFSTPAFTDNKIYSYKLEFTTDDETDTLILKVKRGEVVMIVATDSVLLKGKPGLVKKSLAYEQVAARNDARGDFADIVFLNPPNTKVKINGETYGDRQLPATIKLKATDEEVDETIELQKDDGTPIEKIIVPIKGRTRTIVGFNDLPVSLKKLSREPFTETHELFTPPVRPKK